MTTTVQGIATLALIIAMTLLGAVPAVAETPATATPAPFDVANLYECDGIIDWVDRVYAAQPPDLSPDQWRTVFRWEDGEIDSFTARPSEAETLSQFFDGWASGLEGIPKDLIPYAVADVHAASISYYSALASIYHDVTTGSYLMLTAHVEWFDKARSEMDKAWAYADRVCDGALTEVMSEDRD